MLRWTVNLAWNKTTKTHFIDWKSNSNTILSSLVYNSLVLNYYFPGVASVRVKCFGPFTRYQNLSNFTLINIHTIAHRTTHKSRIWLSVYFVITITFIYLLYCVQRITLKINTTIQDTYISKHLNERLISK